MRESRTYGSVRGALSNERPYRDRKRNPGIQDAESAPDFAALHPGYKINVACACRRCPDTQPNTS